MTTKKGILTVDKFSKDKNWIYVGGDYNEHLKYFEMVSKSYGWDKKPKHKEYCICGHYIEKNCYIYNKSTNKLKIIGIECINKFKLNGRTCDICGEKHKNRIVNRCNDCRYGICDYCDKNIDKKYKICFNCKFN